jgi:hypothetical protein
MILTPQVFVLFFSILMPCLLQNQSLLLSRMLRVRELLLPQMRILGELQSPRVLRLGELLAVLLLNVQLTMSSRRMNLVLFLVDQLSRNVLVRQLNSRLCCDLFAFSLSVKKPHVLLKIELFLNL